MFESHFGLRENPFVAAHQTRYIYPSPEHQEALAHLRFGIENREPFVLITGEVGTGKTTALFDALSEWEDRAIVGLITNSSLTRAELLEEIALRLGLAIAPGASKPQIMVGLEKHLLAIHAEGHRAILLLDEAQNLERELLEEIRLLSNLEANGVKLVQIFLVGQPELEGRLGRPELRQLRQRIAVHYRLRPLGAQDAERYIHHRIAVAGGHGLSVFPPDACHEVHRLTNGIPREMNHLCSQAMITAFVEGAPAVTAEHVRAAAQELEFTSVLGKERRTRHVPPVVERRLGPTVPGAAPPPMRAEMAPAPVAPPARAEIAPAPPSAPQPQPPQFVAPAPPVIERQPTETGPPRLESNLHADEVPPAAVTPVPAAAPATGGAAPAASGDDWSSWFKSLTSEAESAVESERASANAEAADEGVYEDSEADSDDVTEDDDALEDDAFEDDDRDEVEDEAEELDEGPAGPPRLGAAPPAPPREERLVIEPPLERMAPLPVTREPAEPPVTQIAPVPAPRETRMPEPEPVAPPRAMTPTIEPAASTTAFAEALRRTQAVPIPAAHAPHETQAPAAHAAPPVRTPRPLTPGETPVHALPPRLRAKMEEQAESARETNPLPLRLMIAVALLAAVLLGATLAQRFLFPGPRPAATPVEDAEPGAGDDGPASSPAENTEVPPATTSAPAPRTATQSAAAPSTAPAARRPAERPAPPPATASTTSYTVAVGTYLNEARAIEEQAKLGESSPLGARIATIEEGSVPMFRVLMGSFPTRGAAERAASELISRGLVDEARVVAVTASAP
jgi:type II secretory pathway predicted ATPase ExeA